MSNRTSRPKPPPPGNEEASASLNLGEFQHVDTLTLSEAALVLNALVAKRRNDRKNVNETEYVDSCLLGRIESARVMTEIGTLYDGWLTVRLSCL